MRRGDGGDAFRGAFVVEQHAAAAIDLHVDEARREQPLHAPSGGIGGNVAIGHHGGDLLVGNDDAVAIDDAHAVENPGAGQGNAHYRVSVTFIRCGGWSGSRPRARASVSASG